MAFASVEHPLLRTVGRGRLLPRFRNRQVTFKRAARGSFATACAAILGEFRATAVFPSGQPADLARRRSDGKGSGPGVAACSTTPGPAQQQESRPRRARLKSVARHRQPLQSRVRPPARRQGVRGTSSATATLPHSCGLCPQAEGGSAGVAVAGFSPALRAIAAELPKTPRLRRFRAWPL